MNWPIEWKIPIEMKLNSDSIIITYNNTIWMNNEYLVRSKEKRRSEEKGHQYWIPENIVFFRFWVKKKKIKEEKSCVRTVRLFYSIFQLLYCAFVEINRTKRATTTKTNIPYIINTLKDPVVSLVTQIQTCIQSSVSNEHKAQTNE